MNRQIEITDSGGGTHHIPSQNITMMESLPNGNYRLRYVVRGKAAKLEVTTTPATIEAESEYLAEISGSTIKLINSNNIVETISKGASVDLKYALPTGQLINIDNVTMSVAELHTELEKSPAKTSRTSMDTTIGTNRTSIDANAASIATNTDEISTINDRLASARIP